MADFSEIQVGGRLRLELVVNSMGPGGVWGHVKTVSHDSESVWFSPRWVEAAEYIPPPKPAFKRGDWVKARIADEGWQTGGLVLSVDEPAIGPQRAEVSWPNWTTDVQLVTGLEPDEAPND